MRSACHRVASFFKVISTKVTCSGTRFDTMHMVFDNRRGKREIYLTGSCNSAPRSGRNSDEIKNETPRPLYNAYNLVNISTFTSHRGIYYAVAVLSVLYAYSIIVVESRALY